MLEPNILLSASNNVSLNGVGSSIILGLCPPHIYSPVLRTATFLLTKSCGITACASTFMIASPLYSLNATFHPLGSVLLGLSRTTTLSNSFSLFFAKSTIISLVLSEDIPSTSTISIDLWS